MNTKRATEGSILNSGESSGTTIEGSVMELEEQPQAYIVGTELSSNLAWILVRLKRSPKINMRVGDRPWMTILSPCQRIRN
ncbi:hypothetical protein CON64_16705 [Bacillus pseudomycoides]|nr:hypothetical protein CON64_16705 [Bacillus pseudomycoides]